MLDRATKLVWLALVVGEVYMKTLAPRRELFLMREEEGWVVVWYQWSDMQGSVKPTRTTYVTKKDKVGKVPDYLSFDEALTRGQNYFEWWGGEQRRKRVQGW
jgi:hypothetical protein